MRIAAASRGSSCALGGGRRAAEKGDGLSMPVPPLVNEEAGRPAIPIGEAPDAVRERPASGDPPRDEPARDPIGERDGVISASSLNACAVCRWCATGPRTIIMASAFCRCCSAEYRPGFSQLRDHERRRQWKKTTPCSRWRK